MTRFEKQTVMYRVIKKNMSHAHPEALRKKLAKFLTDS